MSEQNTNTGLQALEQRVRSLETRIETFFEALDHSLAARVQAFFKHIRAAVAALKQRLAALAKEL